MSPYAVRALVAGLAVFVAVDTPLEAHASSGVQIVVPEVYELANVILALTPYGQEDPWEVRQDTAYYERLREHFAPVMDHDLLTQVNYSRERWKEYLSFRTDAFAFEFQGDELVRASEFEANEGIRPFDDQLELVEDFVRVSSFRKFFRANADYYTAMVTRYEAEYGVGEMRGFLARHFGAPVHESGYLVVLSPLVYRMNCHRPVAEGVKADFATAPDFVVLEDAERPGVDERAKDSHMLFTEMSHGYVNPLTAGPKEAALVEAAFDPGHWSHESGYDTPLAAWNEYLTWAAYDVFVAECFPAASADVTTQWHFQNQSRGFPFSAWYTSRLRQLVAQEGETVGAVWRELLESCREEGSRLEVPRIEDADVRREGDRYLVSLQFSAPMDVGSPLDVLLAAPENGRTKVVDTLDLTDELRWSDDGTRAELELAFDPVEDPLLVFNWWGAPQAWRSRSGVHLASPSKVPLN